jgi:hypothetical protein
MTLSLIVELPALHRREAFHGQALSQQILQANISHSSDGKPVASLAQRFS